jgi:hypothetical protein
MNSTLDENLVEGTIVVVHVSGWRIRHSAPSALRIAVVLSRTFLPMISAVDMDLTRYATVARAWQRRHKILFVVDVREI